MVVKMPSRGEYIPKTKRKDGSLKPDSLTKPFDFVCCTKRSSGIKTGKEEVIIVRSDVHRQCNGFRSRAVETEADHVIDLGAPRRLRTSPHSRLPTRRKYSSYTPNPRLYPGPQPKPKPKRKNSNESQRRRRKNVFRKPVPNARLYRPAPSRPHPPPPSPRASWPPPPSARTLDSASRVALRFTENRRRTSDSLQSSVPTSGIPPVTRARGYVSPHCMRIRVVKTPASSPRRSPNRSPAAITHQITDRRLVVTLPPAAAGGDATPHQYKPKSTHFRHYSLDTDSASSSPIAGRPSPAPLVTATALAMDAGNRNSNSPEECSEGNDSLSAPSEFLAEFLSAIMRRQYTEALKYCRLILQYEPHNATARGFYPLLQLKVQGVERAEKETEKCDSSSEELKSEEASRHSPISPSQREELMEQDPVESGGSASEGEGADASEGSFSQSSLELDSSDVAAQSSPSFSISRRTDHTDMSAASASVGCWESKSTGSASASRSDADDNGNTAPAHTHTSATHTLHPDADDVENDNAASGDTHYNTHLKSDSRASLQRLRAQFACSIK